MNNEINETKGSENPFDEKKPLPTAGSIASKVTAPPSPPEPKVPEEEKEEKTQVVLSHSDAYVHDRLKAQPKTLEQVDIVVSEQDPENKKHQLTLPEELEPYCKKYTFRWIFKHKRAIDHECDVRGYVLANKMYFPDLPKHKFTVSGSIERGDMILGFIPKAKADEYKALPSKKSADIVRSAFKKHEGDPRYYKPKDAETGSQVTMI